MPSRRLAGAARTVAVALLLAPALAAQVTLSELFEGHEAVLEWHNARVAELGQDNSQDALLGKGGRLKLMVNPLLAGEGAGALLPREVYERPGGAPLPDAVTAALGERIAGESASIHSQLEQMLGNAFNLLFDNRVDVRDRLTKCIDDSANDNGAVVVLAGDVLLEADPDTGGLLVDLELRLLRVAVDDDERSQDGERVMPISAVELLWSDRQLGRAELDGSDKGAVLSAFRDAVVDALASGLVANLWGDPDLLEVQWFKQREGVLGESLRDAFADAAEDDR